MKMQRNTSHVHMLMTSIHTICICIRLAWCALLSRSPQNFLGVFQFWIYFQSQQKKHRECRAAAYKWAYCIYAAGKFIMHTSCYFCMSRPPQRTNEYIYGGKHPQGNLFKWTIFTRHICAFHVETKITEKN